MFGKPLCLVKELHHRPTSFLLPVTWGGWVHTPVSTHRPSLTFVSNVREERREVVSESFSMTQGSGLVCRRHPYVWILDFKCSLRLTLPGLLVLLRKEVTRRMFIGPSNLMSYLWDRGAFDVERFPNIPVQMDSTRNRTTPVSQEMRP